MSVFDPHPSIPTSTNPTSTIPTFASPTSTIPTFASPATSTDSPLIRFITDGLLATVDSYRAGSLPLHRFAWELRTRIDSLAELDPPSRTVTRLRWLLRAVELLHSELTTRTDAHSANRQTELTADEQNDLTVTLRNLTLVLATLNPRSPLDPAGAARPISIEPAAIVHVRATNPLRLTACGLTACGHVASWPSSHDHP